MDSNLSWIFNSFTPVILSVSDILIIIINCYNKIKRNCLYSQERTIDPIKINYPAKGNPKEEAKEREAKEKKAKEYYVRQLSEPVPLIQEEQPNTSKLYLDFLKSIIYCKASADLTKFNWIPPDLKEMNMTICSILSSQR